MLLVYPVRSSGCTIVNAGGNGEVDDDDDDDATELVATDDDDDATELVDDEDGIKSLIVDMRWYDAAGKRRPYRLVLMRWICSVGGADGDSGRRAASPDQRDVDSAARWRRLCGGS